MKYLKLPTKKQLEKIFDWDENGSLRWKNTVRANIIKGKEVGYINSLGYWSLEINGKCYKKHRILFVLYHGKNNLGNRRIDHIDGNPSNNAKSNLRIETNKNNNSHNYKKPITNTSGCKGVSFNKNHGKWYAHIKLHGKKINLGFYKSFIYACVVRRRAAKLYHGDWRRD